MFVKGLTLKGFKSFADTTTLELQPGVNVVVGPNGSGKSNIIDAVAWVLGAQGARALRGGKMDDVIFAGTTKRTGLGRAEVSLIIDNSDGKVPIEFTEFTITRTLFRTGESEYAINGVGCRLLDIQELLSDSGVGRRQHVIVSQGNLDAVLTARPEDRRMIIEEAAGVLKYRKRREKAQRRLSATEQNLERLQDLVREVRSQMRPLQKQANAAMRYDAVVSELRALKLFVTARDIEQVQHRIDNANAEFAEIAERDVALRAELLQADESVSQAQAELDRADIGALAEYVERLESLYHQARSQSAVMTERRRTWESEIAVEVSKDVVAQLEHDAATTRRDLAALTTERDSLEVPFAALHERERVLSSEWLVFEEEWGDGLPVLTNEAAELRGAASSLRKNMESLETEISQRQDRAERLLSTQTEVEAQVQVNTELLAQLQESHIELTERLGEVTTQLDDARLRDESCQVNVRNVEQACSVAVARVDALTSALDASRARAGAERLASIRGVIGTLADLVEVDEAYLAAFEAAVGEAMTAVIVGSIDVAKQGMEMLRQGDEGGAVLVLDSMPIEMHGAPAGCPADTLRTRVRGTKKGVDLLLDRLMCCCVVVDGDFNDALDVALRYPDLVVVTKHGDRFSRNAWTMGNGGVGATQAAVNRAIEEHADAISRLSDIQLAALSSREELERVESLASELGDALAANVRDTEKLESEIERANQRIASLAEDRASIEEHFVQLRDRHADDAAQLAVIDARLPELEAAEATGEARARLWREARGVLEDRTTALRDERQQIEVRRDALQERETYLTKRLANLEDRLAQHAHNVTEAAQRRERLWERIAALDAIKASLDARIVHIESHLEAMRDARDVSRRRNREVSDRLESMRRRRSVIERELMSIAERRQGFEVRQAELRLRLDSLGESLQMEYGVDFATACEAPTPDDLGDKTPKQRIAELERDVRQMGPVNPLAIEEFREVEERHNFLDQQLQDVQASRRELMRVIRSVDTEIVEVFRSAFDDVSRHFGQLFDALFPGGSGRLRLTDPEVLLETGIEIEAKPSGKNVRTLSLLSGGERSLVALAFLFAVFRSRPSPFYLLDEVEAALDDVNLSRFLLLMEQFRDEAQLVVVSHQKRTMETADCLFGVTMQPGGSSKVVSERVRIDLREHERQGAAPNDTHREVKT